MDLRLKDDNGYTRASGEREISHFALIDSGLPMKTLLHEAEQLFREACRKQGLEVMGQIRCITTEYRIKQSTHVYLSALVRKTGAAAPTAT